MVFASQRLPRHHRHRHQHVLLLEGHQGKSHVAYWPRYVGTFVGFSEVVFAPGTLVFATAVQAFVWLDWMLHHRVDPTNAIIGGDNSQTRSPWGLQVKRLTKICWHLTAPRSTLDFSCKVGLNLALDLVTTCCGHQTV